MSLSGTQSDQSGGFITSFIFESKNSRNTLLGVGQFDYQPCQSSRGVERVGPARKELLIRSCCGLLILVRGQ